MELSAAEYDQAFHYTPMRNYTGAKTRNNTKFTNIVKDKVWPGTTPSYTPIPGPVGGRERLFTIQLLPCTYAPRLNMEVT